MIIVRLIGGLGNQFFQYAVGRYLAEKHNTDLKIDILGFETYKLHKYSLFPFNIKEDVATAEEVSVFTQHKQGFINGVFTKLFCRSARSPSSHVQEKHFHFDHEILNLSDNVYLDGYWQSEKYFIGIEDIIRREFTVKNRQNGKDKELAKIITSCEAVSLHIRRADYVSNANTQQIYGTCGLDFYYRSIAKITQTVSNPHFFIFSDDPEWARNNLKLDYSTTLVDHNNADKNYEDLRLMSQCKHNIIANSSFSWWGAWLNNTPNKLVCAPRRWLKDTTAAGDYNAFIDNLLPPEWTRL